MRSPLRWPGGKAKLASFILQRMPEHRLYVEACCGGASVFWAKPRAWSACEVLNDADGELINFYYELHRHGRLLARQVDSMPYSRGWFVRMKKSRPTRRLPRAVRFWYLNRVAFGARRCSPTFGVQASRPAYVLPAEILANLDLTIERLRGVLFEAVDLRRLVELYDRPDALFYLDPPYYGLSQPYACTFTQQDHRDLATQLHSLRGSWLLSYNDCREVLDLYPGREMAEVRICYSMGRNSSGGDGIARATGELLISNRAFTTPRQP
jgi:DNA adenine methylase